MIFFLQYECNIKRFTRNESQLKNLLSQIKHWHCVILFNVLMTFNYKKTLYNSNNFREIHINCLSFIVNPRRYLNFFFSSWILIFLRIYVLYSKNKNKVEIIVHVNKLQNNTRIKKKKKEKKLVTSKKRIYLSAEVWEYNLKYFCWVIIFEIYEATYETFMTIVYWYFFFFSFSYF